MAQLTQLEPAKPSNFDAHKPPETALIEDCVHCGFCLPACPTYVLWGEEMDSPRGRIYMMKKSAQGEAPLDQRFRLHMDNCLGCMACMTACPSGVQYNKLIEDTRAQVERNIPRTTTDSLFRKLLFATFPYVKRLRLLALPMLIYQRSGLQKLVRASGLLRLLPKRLAQMEALLPRVPTHFMQGLPAKVSPATEPRRRVGMLSGCVQQVFFQHVNQATARVLAAEGCEVVIPQAQQCCGALMLHSGLDEQAAALARQMIATFEAANVDTIVINAAGCGSTMKEYGHLLRDDPAWAARAAAFSAKCKDISEILCELPRPFAAPPSAHARGLPRRLPPAPRTGHPRRAAALAGHDSRARGRGDRRGNAVLRLGRRLQPAPPRAGQSVRRPQGRKPARDQGRRGHLRKSWLPAATDEFAAPPRARGHARLPHG